MRRKLHKQQRANTCAMASLRTVLHLQYDLQVAEEALSILGTDPYEPIKKYGTSTQQLRRVVKRASRALNAAKTWRLAVKRHGTIEDLARELGDGWYPMVSVFEQTEITDYHMIVVLAVDDGRVQIWDPSPSASRAPRWMPLPQFLKWWNGDGELTWYGVVRGAYYPAVEVEDGRVGVAGASGGWFRIAEPSGNAGPWEVLEYGAADLRDRRTVRPQSVPGPDGADVGIALVRTFDVDAVPRVEDCDGNGDGES